MFHILIVEDVLNTLEELRELLKEVFPDMVQIEPADNVEAGLAIIQKAATDERLFDIAILDFRLPAAPGEPDVIDEKLCQAIKEHMPDTLVIHITSFQKDEAVINHIDRKHSPKSPRAAVIPKTAYWTVKLLEEVKAHLYGQVIERQLISLFGLFSVEGLTQRGMSPARGSLTHGLAALSRDIVTYWRDLSESTKSKIEKYFIVNDEQEVVRIGLRIGMEK